MIFCHPLRDGGNTLMIFIYVIGTGVNIDDQLGARLLGRSNRLRIPYILTYTQTNAAAFECEYTGLGPRVKVTLLIKYIVVRQNILVILSDEHLILHDACSIIYFTVLIAGRADNDSQSLAGSLNLVHSHRNTATDAGSE